MKNDIKCVIVVQDVSSKYFLGNRQPTFDYRISSYIRDRIFPTLGHARIFRTHAAAQKAADWFNARLKGSGFKKRYVVRFVPKHKFYHSLDVLVHDDTHYDRIKPRKAL